MAQGTHVKRVEKKYILSRLEAEKLYRRLKVALPGDPFAGYEPYVVRSLYFDSFHNRDYFDKVGGILERKKIRIRVYGENTDVIKLELKQKSGQWQEKSSARISRELYEEMRRGEYRGLHSMDNEAFKQLYGIMTKELYRPVCVVEYDRRAFALPTNDIRITLDSNVRTSEGNFDLFSSAAFYRPADVFDKVILEVKYNRFLLSYVKDILSLTETYDGAYSKYAASRMLLS